MLQQRLVWIVYLTAIAISWGLAAADQPSATQPAKSAAAAKPADGIETRSPSEVKAPAANETIDQLIEQLDSADFAKREAASGKLAAKGSEAIPALEKAGVKGDLEVSSRAVGVLGKLLKSSDEKTAKAAEESLQRLADGDSPAAARKAKSILEKKNGVANNKNNPFAPNGLNMPMPAMPGGGMGRIIINGGMLQIGGNAGMKTLSVSNNNGVREIKATDGDKTVKIEDDPNNGIKIQCTDKVNGKEVTKKYEAKNVEELKKKQPEGYKIYKEYGEQGNGGAIQLQMGGAIPAVPAMPAIPLQPAIPPLQLAPVPPGAVPAPVLGNGVQLDMAMSQLKVMSAKLDALRRNEALKNASPEKKAELKKQIDELSQRVDELRKQVESK